MHSAVRSPVVAGVTLVGASAIALSSIALSPIAPTPDIHQMEVQLAAMLKERLENPIAVFAPVAESAMADIERLILVEIQNPVPIVRAVLTNQVNYAFTLVGGVSEAAVALSNGAWYLPGELKLATELALNGDYQEALGVLERAVLGPLGEATDDVSNALRRIVGNQIRVAQNLSVAVPEAAKGVVLATISSVEQVTQAGIDASESVAEALKTGNPIGVANAITNGAANVAQTMVDTTIGSPGMVYLAKSDTAARTPSIAVSVNEGRREIAAAINSPKKELVVAADATPAAQLKRVNPVRRVVQQVRGDIKKVEVNVKTEVQKIKKKLGIKGAPAPAK